MIRRATRLGRLMLCFAMASGLSRTAQADEHCTVSVLNRTAQVQPDGSWSLPNVPASFGQVRARVTCSQHGLSQFGQSDFFTIAPNGSIEVDTITFSTPALVPASLAISGGNTLTVPGASIQLQVTASYADTTTCPDQSTGTTCDVHLGSSGTNYTTSNPAMATVNADGAVSVPATGAVSGSVLITAMHEGAIAVFAVQVMLSADSDGDCMADDLELSLGLNPNDWTDALGDLDGDGLTNRQECQLLTGINDTDSDDDLLTDGQEVNFYGTNPLNPDHDGDKIPDSVEIAVNTLPKDPLSFNWSTSLAGGLIITPPAATLVLLPPQVPEVQLAVTGVFVNGLTIDLLQADPLNQIPDTGFTTDAPDVCTAHPDGLVAGGPQTGSCTVTATNSGQEDASVISVTKGEVTYAPRSYLMHEVDVQGDYAYIAAGATGLVVVDVSDPLVPVDVATEAVTPGSEARDVRVLGRYAYVATAGVGPAWQAGLDVFDLGPSGAAPLLVAHLDLVGDCVDLEVQGQRAFIAASEVGLHVVDLIDPEAPVLLSTTSVPGATTLGVGVLEEIAVIVSDSDAVQAFDVTSPGDPQLIPPVVFTNNASNSRDVVVLRDPNDNPPTYTAVVAQQDNSGKALAVYRDLAANSGPGTPAFSGGASAALVDVARVGSLILGADLASAAPTVRVFDVGNPALPGYLAAINFAQLFPDPLNPTRDDDSTGIAVDERYVYVTAVSDDEPTLKSALYIGQYRTFADSAEIAPTVALSTPSQVRQGQVIQFAAQASDDIGVAVVEFFVDGQVVFRDTTGPYEFAYRVPLDASDFMVEARASDFGTPSPNTGSSGAQQVIVLSDAPPFVTIDLPAPGSTVVSGSRLTVRATAEDDIGIDVIEFSSPPLSDVVPGSGTLLTAERYVVVPGGVTSKTVTVSATDTAGNHDTESVSLGVTDPDPGTTVTGQVFDAMQPANPIQGAKVRAFGAGPATTNSAGLFSLPVAPTIFDPLRVVAISDGAQGRLYGSVFGTPVLAPTFDVGDIVVSDIGDTKTSFPAGAGPGSLAVGDLNRDGLLDIVTARRAPHKVSVLLGEVPAAGNIVGLGSPQEIATGNYLNRIELGDLNADGFLDVVTGGPQFDNGNTGDIFVFLGSGDGC